MRQQMKTPIVSVIIPCFNNGEHVVRAIESVQNQTLTDIEIIIVDDNSDDNSVIAVETFIAANCKATLVKLTDNGGAGVARNAGLELAKAKYTAFLDADDRWYKNKLEMQVAFLERNKLSHCYSSYRAVSSNSVAVVRASRTYTSSGMFFWLNNIGCSTFIGTTEPLRRLKFPTARQGQDAGLWYKILKSGLHISPLDVVLVEYTIRDNSLSSNKTAKICRAWGMLLNECSDSWLRAIFNICGLVVTSLRKKIQLL